MEHYNDRPNDETSKIMATEWTNGRLAASLARVLSIKAFSTGGFSNLIFIRKYISRVNMKLRTNGTNGSVNIETEAPKMVYISQLLHHFMVSQCAQIKFSLVRSALFYTWREDKIRSP